MAKSLKDANWGCGGLFCLLLAAVNFVFFLLTGSGIASPHGFQAKGIFAVLGSIFFFAFGIVSLFVWFFLKARNRRKPRDDRRWRKRL